MFDFDPLIHQKMRNRRISHGMLITVESDNATKYQALEKRGKRLFAH